MLIRAQCRDQLEKYPNRSTSEKSQIDASENQAHAALTHESLVAELFECLGEEIPENAGSQLGNSLTGSILGEFPK